MDTLRIFGVPIVEGLEVEGDARHTPYHRRGGVVLQVIEPKGQWDPISETFSESDWIIRVGFGVGGEGPVYDCGPMDIVPIWTPKPTYLVLPTGAVAQEYSDASLEVDQELLAYVAKHPEVLDGMHPGRFEELVAAVYRNQGFHVERLGSWNHPNGGVDIVAITRSFGAGELRLAIQCKAIRRDRRVDAAPIRELAGVLDKFHAHKGILITTSYFTDNAWREARTDFWRIDLQDRLVLESQLQRLFPTGRSTRS